jgi:hypothetical protein
MYRFEEDDVQSIEMNTSVSHKFHTCSAFVFPPGNDTEKINVMKRSRDHVLITDLNAGTWGLWHGFMSLQAYYSQRMCSRCIY